MLKLALIDPPALDMRSHSSGTSVEDLVESIKALGLLQPIVVKKVAKRYEVLAGARRYRAVTAMQWKEVPAIVFPASGMDGELAKLHENQVRRDVNPVEECAFLDLLMREYKLTGKALAKKIGRAESYVSERLALLDAPEELRQAIQSGGISFSAARELLRIKSPNVRASWINHALTSGINDATARQWRIDANQATDTSPVDETRPPSAQPQPGHSLKVQCALTGDLVAMEHTLLIRVAKSAWEKLQEDMKG